MAKRDVTIKRERLLRAIGERIARRRKRLGWSQADLARRVGVTVETQCRRERGRLAFSVDVLAVYAEAMAVTVSWFVREANR